MVTRTEYINILINKEKRIRRLFTPLILIFTLIALILFTFVFIGQHFGVPASAIKYLRDTTFYLFSSVDLKNILIKNSGNDRLFIHLFLVYWLFHISAGADLLLLVMYTIVTRRLFPYGYQEGLVATARLVEAIDNYLIKSTAMNQRRLLNITDRESIYHFLSPIKKNWFKSSEYQWLPAYAIRKDERSIIMAINQFPQSLVSAIRNNLNLPPYRDALQCLEEFFFIVAKRSDPRLRVAGQHKNFADEVQHLKMFSNLARPLIIESARVIRGKPKGKGAVFVRLRELYESQFVQGAVLISWIAGTVMLFGVLVFKIDVKQAFLTWFTVAFGSLTISIGVTSVAIAKKSAKQSVDDSTNLG